MDQKDTDPSPEKPVERVSPPVKPGKWDDLAQSLRNRSWDQLQERFIEAMDERSDMENALQKETADLLEVWDSVQSLHTGTDGIDLRLDVYCMVANYRL